MVNVKITIFLSIFNVNFFRGFLNAIIISLEHKKALLMLKIKVIDLKKIHVKIINFNTSFKDNYYEETYV